MYSAHHTICSQNKTTIIVLTNAIMVESINTATTAIMVCSPLRSQIPYVNSLKRGSNHSFENNLKLF